MSGEIIKGIKQAAWIVLIAAMLGMIINLFHPRGVKISSKRPALKFAPDTVLAQDLPDVSVTVNDVNTNNNEAAEPMLITTAQVLQLKENNQAVIIDARSKAEFLNAHVPGAINLPYKNLSEYKSEIDSLPHDSWLICYCNGLSCDQAELLAHELTIAGYDLVAVYFDGLDGWKKAGNEISGKEAAKSEK